MTIGGETPQTSQKTTQHDHNILKQTEKKGPIHLPGSGQFFVLKLLEGGFTISCGPETRHFFPQAVFSQNFPVSTDNQANHL